MGPWGVGYLLTDRWGLVFSYGIYVSGGYWFPHRLTNVFHAYFVFLTMLILLAAVVNVAAKRFRQKVEGGTQGKTGVAGRFRGNVPDFWNSSL